MNKLSYMGAKMETNQNKNDMGAVKKWQNENRESRGDRTRVRQKERKNELIVICDYSPFYKYYFYDDDDCKAHAAGLQPYADWCDNQVFPLEKHARPFGKNYDSVKSWVFGF